MVVDVEKYQVIHHHQYLQKDMGKQEQVEVAVVPVVRAHGADLVVVDLVSL